MEHDPVSRREGGLGSCPQKRDQQHQRLEISARATFIIAAAAKLLEKKGAGTTQKNYLTACLHHTKYRLPCTRAKAYSM